MRKFLIKFKGVDYEVECEEITNGSVQTAAPVFTPAAAPVAVPAPATAPAAAPSAAPSPAPAAAPAKPVSAGTEGAVKINSPMPGTILKVNVNPGDSVKKGDCLLILEAMKMENEILAPNDATVASVNVAKGSSVNAGDLLISLS